jgi:hypothetical protein
MTSSIIWLVVTIRLIIIYTIHKWKRTVLFLAAFFMKNPETVKFILLITRCLNCVDRNIIFLAVCHGGRQNKCIHFALGAGICKFIMLVKEHMFRILVLMFAHMVS